MSLFRCGPAFAFGRAKKEAIEERQANASRSSYHANARLIGMQRITQTTTTESSEESTTYTYHPDGSVSETHTRKLCRTTTMTQVDRAFAVDVDVHIDTPEERKQFIEVTIPEMKQQQTEETMLLNNFAVDGDLCLNGILLHTEYCHRLGDYLRVLSRRYAEQTSHLFPYPVGNSEEIVMYRHLNALFHIMNHARLEDEELWYSIDGDLKLVNMYRNYLAIVGDLPINEETLCELMDDSRAAEISAFSSDHVVAKIDAVRKLSDALKSNKQLSPEEREDIIKEINRLRPTTYEKSLIITEEEKQEFQDTHHAHHCYFKYAFKYGVNNSRQRAEYLQRYEAVEKVKFGPYKTVVYEIKRSPSGALVGFREAFAHHTQWGKINRALTTGTDPDTNSTFIVPDNKSSWLVRETVRFNKVGTLDNPVIVNMSPYFCMPSLPAPELN